MSDTLSPAWLDWPETRRLVAAFAAASALMRFVGGAVRDAWLGKAVQDVDVATPLVPLETMALLEKAGIRAIPTGIDHGTVTALVDGKPFEITTLRKDVSTDGRHAEVAYTDDWQQDAARRDFTINALYLSPQGEVFDYFDGIADLAQGHVRFIGVPEQRIREDYLRILRFFRFYAWYGNGEADAESVKACSAAASHITSLSGERIQQEMKKLVVAPGAQAALMLMQAHGIARGVFGGDIRAEALAVVTQLEAEIASPPLPLARLAAMTHDSDFAARWRLSGRDIEWMEALQHYLPADLDIAAQKKQLRTMGAALYMQTLMVSAARQGQLDAYRKMLRLPEQWQSPIFPVGGDDLITLGMAPGKAMGTLLHQLEKKWEESDYGLSKQQLLEMALTL